MNFSFVIDTSSPVINPAGVSFSFFPLQFCPLLVTSVLFKSLNCVQLFAASVYEISLARILDCMGEEWTGSLGPAHANYPIQNG